MTMAEGSTSHKLTRRNGQSVNTFDWCFLISLGMSSCRTCITLSTVMLGRRFTLSGNIPKREVLKAGVAWQGLTREAVGLSAYLAVNNPRLINSFNLQSLTSASGPALAADSSLWSATLVRDKLAVHLKSQELLQVSRFGVASSWTASPASHCCKLVAVQGGEPIGAVRLPFMSSPV